MCSLQDRNCCSIYQVIFKAFGTCDRVALDSLITLHGRDIVAQQCRIKKVLCTAAHAGLVPVLQWLADIGAATLEDFSNFHPIRYAASHGHIAALDWFAQHYASLGRTSEEFATECRADDNYAIWWAAFDGRVSTLKWMAAHGVVTRDVCLTSRVSTGDGAAIHAAAGLGRIRVLEWFAKHYTTMGLTEHDFISDLLAYKGIIFWNAASGGAITTLMWIKQRCLAAGITLKEFSSYLSESNPLSSAIIEGHIDTANWLAEHGAASLEECYKVLDYGEISSIGLHWLADHGLTRTDFVEAGYESAWLDWMGARLAAADRSENIRCYGAQGL